MRPVTVLFISRIAFTAHNQLAPPSLEDPLVADHDSDAAAEVNDVPGGGTIPIPAPLVVLFALAIHTHGRQVISMFSGPSAGFVAVVAYSTVLIPEHEGGPFPNLVKQLSIGVISVVPRLFVRHLGLATCNKKKLQAGTLIMYEVVDAFLAFSAQLVPWNVQRVHIISILLLGFFASLLVRHLSKLRLLNLLATAVIVGALVTTMLHVERTNVAVSLQTFRIQDITSNLNQFEYNIFNVLLAITAWLMLHAVLGCFQSFVASCWKPMNLSHSNDSTGQCNLGIVQTDIAQCMATSLVQSSHSGRISANKDFTMRGGCGLFEPSRDQNNLARRRQSWSGTTCRTIRSSTPEQILLPKQSTAVPNRRHSDVAFRHTDMLPPKDEQLQAKRAPKTFRTTSAIRNDSAASFVAIPSPLRNQCLSSFHMEHNHTMRMMQQRLEVLKALQHPWAIGDVAEVLNVLEDSHDPYILSGVIEALADSAHPLTLMEAVRARQLIAPVVNDPTRRRSLP